MVRDIARPRWGLCCIGLLLGGCLGGGDSVGPNVGNNSPVSPNEGDVVITQTEITDCHREAETAKAHRG